MNALYDILRKPLVTEKTTAMKSEGRKVALEVARWANKTQIKEAAQKLFGVSVDAVNTSIVRGKDKRVGKSMGRRSNWKKAVLTLKEGSDLDVFGVVAEAPLPVEQE
jgi:large subunit ribosomal protein L23